MEEIVGYLSAVIFNNPSNNYSVIKIKLDQKKDEKVTVVGYFKIPSKYDLVKYCGQFIDNKKYGIQFSVESYEVILPKSKTAIIRYLSSSLFRKVGGKTATKIYEELGEDCLEIIKDNPNALDVFHFNEEIKTNIINGINKNANLNESIKLFVSRGISMKSLIKMDAIYGDKLVEKVMGDPYILVKDIDGLSFRIVDKLALSLGVELNDVKRLKALILYCLKNIAYKTLDTYTSKEFLFKECLHFYPDFEYDDYLKMYKDLLENFQLTEDEYGRVFDNNIYESEAGIARLLKPYLKENKVNLSQSFIDKEIDSISQLTGIEYSIEQKEAIYNALNNRICIITGGPGTGKTTVLNAIIKIYRGLNENDSIHLVAPTGRASKRMSELSNYSSSTIHRFLKWDMDTNSFKMDEFNPLIGSYLIIDEFSMVDCQLFYSLLKATSSFKKILLIGDDQQLEPLLPGSVLKDLIESNLIKVNNLTINHRQTFDSGIIPLCLDVNQGTLNEENLVKSDVEYIPVDLEFARETILDKVKQLNKQGYKENDIQILSPMYDGVCGIKSLNLLIRDYFNPPSNSKNEGKVGTIIFRENDKVLQLKNQPDYNVFNGDIGKIIDINLEDELKITCNFDGNLVEYSGQELQNLSLAYAISVHKSQGSEFDVVIMPFLSENFMMLKRKLIYTGFSRAKKKLIIIGNKKYIHQGIQRIDSLKKKSTLKERLLNNNLKVNDVIN